MRMRKFNGQQPVFKCFLSEWNVNNLHSDQCEQFLLLRTTESCTFANQEFSAKSLIKVKTKNGLTRPSLFESTV